MGDDLEPERAKNVAGDCSNFDLVRRCENAAGSCFLRVFSWLFSVMATSFFHGRLPPLSLSPSNEPVKGRTTEIAFQTLLWHRRHTLCLCHSLCVHAAVCMSMCVCVCVCMCTAGCFFRLTIQDSSWYWW